MMQFAPTNLDAFAAAVWTLAVEFLPRLVAAAGLLVAGLILSRWTSRLTIRIAEGTGRVDPTLEPIVASLARYAVLIVVLIAALSQLGVQTASVLAVLGAAGLAIGLALQGTLSNIAAGIMLIWLRPFRVGDYIEVIAGNPISGSVREIGLFACLIDNFDGTVLFAPNATIWNFPLRNHNSNGGRLVSLSVALSQSADLEKARATLLETMASDGRVLKSPAPDVFVDRLDSGDFSLTGRMWTGPAEIEAVQRSMIARVKRRLDSAAVESLDPSHIARLTPPDSDPSRSLASEAAPPSA